ncbi:MAG: diguanylate cyclase [Armatimonadetes bacterium]|nr:diguanylate cyclase [Armatimonadota bacterium]
MAQTNAKARTRALREGKRRKTLALIIQVVVPVAAVCAQFLIVGTLESRSPTGSAAAKFEALKLATLKLEAAAQSAALQSGAPRTIALDRLDDIMADLPNLLARARSAGGSDMFGRSQRRQDELISILKRAVSEVSTASPDKQSLVKISEASQALGGLAAKAADDEERRDKGQAAFVRVLEVNATVLVTLSLLACGFIVSRLHVGALRTALGDAETANLSMSERLTRLDEIGVELVELRAQNKVYERKLSRSLDDTEAANEMLRYASHRFQELFQGLPVACFTTDVDGTIFEWNRAASELFQFQAETVYLREAFSLLAEPSDVPALRKACRSVSAGEVVDDLEWRALRFSDRASIEILTMAHPMRSNSGSVHGILFSCFDHTQRKRAAEMLEQQLQLIREMNEVLELQRAELMSTNEQLQQLASKDGLTGLNNHRTFQAYAENAFKEATLNDRPLSIVLMDVDRFKSFNDDFGHQSGDDVLKGIAKILTEQSRPDDFVARYGGEEFVLVLVGASESEGCAVAERMRSGIEAASWPLRQVTASFGVAGLDASATSIKDLVERADLALYASKEGGRNQITAHSRMRPAAA